MEWRLAARVIGRITLAVISVRCGIAVELTVVDMTTQIDSEYKPYLLYQRLGIGKCNVNAWPGRFLRR